MLVGTDATIRDLAEQLIAAVWPDHPPIHVEVVDAPDSEAAGLSAEWLGHYYTDTPTRCIIVNSAHLPDDPAERDQAVVAVVLHELSHTLTDGEPEAVDPEHRADAADVLHSALNGPRPTLGGAPWDRHEWPFVRALVHLVYRAQRHSYRVDTFQALPFQVYRLSSFSRYEAMLRDELESRSQESIEIILETDPPPAFTTLWTEDVQCYHLDKAKRRPERESVPMDIFSKLRTRKQEKVNSYRGLVALLASGDDVPPADVEAVLQASGKNLDDLEADVRTQTERVRIKNEIGTLPALRRELAAAQKVLNAEIHHFEQAETRWGEVGEPARAKAAYIERQINALENARRNLQTQPADPEIAEKMKETHRRKCELSSARFKLQREVEDAESSASFHDEHAKREYAGALVLDDMGGANATAVGISNSIEKKEYYTRVASDKRATLASVEAELAELEKQEAALLNEAERS